MFKLHTILLLVTLSIFPIVLAFGQKSIHRNHPVPKLVQLDSKGKEYLPILTGPPETATMHSGLVTLKPGKDVGKHSTKDNEEIVIALSGKGEMRITGGDTLAFTKGQAVYCPPRTEHDVFNTGTEDFQYVYIVAKAGSK